MIPRLVNPDNFLKVPEIEIKPSKIKTSFYLNIILFILFIVILLFFLYYCKYNKIEEQPLPYSVVYNLK